MDVRERKSDLETFRVLFSESSGASEEEAAEYAALMRERVLLENRGEVSMMKNANTKTHVDTFLSSSARPQRSHCFDELPTPIQGASSSGDLEFAEPGLSVRENPETAAEINTLENASDPFRENLDFGIEQDLETCENRELKAFTCPAGNSCGWRKTLVSSASHPTSTCQNKACNRDSNDGGRLHDACAYKVWQICGESWPEPCSGNGGSGKICSVKCHRKTLQRADEEAG
jgi:hypothetical protein